MPLHDMVSVTGEGPRVLIITRLFPNAAEPLAAAFNRQQFVALGRQCALEVAAVIPTFPGARFFSRWSATGRRVDVPLHEAIDGLPVQHPRVFYVPRVGHALAPLLYVASLLPFVPRWRRQVDVVLGSWAFPDGVAAVFLGALLGVPVALKLHGSDMDVIAEKPAARRWLRWALPRAARVIAVSRALADKAQTLGAPADRLAIVANGVDRGIFHPQDRLTARWALRGPPTSRWIVYVGRLETDKGIFDLLQAYRRLAGDGGNVGLVLIGEGPQAARCREEASRYGGRMLVLGARPLEEVARWMAASDVVTLPSWHEGTPNVVLEALASGRRVVATQVGGIPDVVTSPTLGRLVPPRDPAALASALAEVLSTPYDAASIAAAAPGTWSESAAQLLGVLTGAMAIAGPQRDTVRTALPVDDVSPGARNPNFVRWG